MYCKECIHHDVCYLLEIDNDIRESQINVLCESYIPATDVVSKSEFVETKRKIFEEIEENMIDIKLEFSTLKALGERTFNKIKKRYTE